MNHVIKIYQQIIGGFCVALLLSACATSTPDKQSPEVSPPADPSGAANSPYSQFNKNTPGTNNVAVASKEKVPLGLVIRDLNTTGEMSLVLMNGIENVLTLKADWEGLSSEDTLDYLLKTHKLSRFNTKYYTFICPPDYEVLSTIDLSHLIPKKYAKIKVNIAFGADTPLFSALALIGHSTGLTLVADQVMGDSLCGELRLYDTPLPQALEALVQSARVQPRAIKVQGTQDYILLLSAAHSLRSKVQSGDIPKAMARKLAENCSISLLFYTPSGSEANSPLGASKLHTVLSELSLQIGIPIKAEGKINHLPVNPMVLNNVSREMALELILHQWMLPIFTYEVQDGSIMLGHSGEE